MYRRLIDWLILYCIVMYCCRVFSINGVIRILMFFVKCNKMVFLFCDFVFFRVLFGEYFELELVEVLFCWLMVEFYWVLWLELCLFVFKILELKYKIIICFLERIIWVIWNGKLSFGVLWSYFFYYFFIICFFFFILFLFCVSLLF